MTTHPERYEKKSGGGCLMLFGLPFLAAGLAIMTLGVLGVKDDSGNSIPIYFALPFGGVFAAVGAGLVFGRGGIVFDKRTNEAIKWWGLLVPMKRTVAPLHSMKEVAITKEIRRSDKSTYTVYPVRVAHAGDQFKICEPRDYQKARQEAEEVAKFLNVELRDASAGGEGVVRQAADLDQSIREQARAKGEIVEIPPMPAGARIRHDLNGGRLTLEIPAPGVSPVILIMAAVMFLAPVGFMAFFLQGFFNLDEAPSLFRIVFYSFFLLFLAPVVLIPGRMVLSGMSKERITVTPDKLELSLVAPYWTRAKSIPASEIEELELIRHEGNGGREVNPEQVPKIVKNLALLGGGGGTIMARSDKQTLNFGRMLNREEAEWALALVKRVLTS